MAKYLAEGFLEDAGTLLNDFTDRCTLEFPLFAEVWRKHNFSLIFMGRPDHTETSEFVNEVFRITTEFLSSPSFYQQVGTVYLLYALFRNQISDPPIRIRIEIHQWKTIKILLIGAIANGYRCLHFIINYLVKHAFIYVANQTLKGPVIASMQKVSRNHEIISNLKTNYKSSVMEYSVSNNLAALRDLSLKYAEEKKNAGNDEKLHLTATSENYEELINDLTELVNPDKMKKPDKIGTRRAKIKAQSFIRKTKDRYGNATDEESKSESEVTNRRVLVKKRVRAKRVPKHERRVGRPSSKPKKVPKVEKEVVDISHLLSQQQDFYLPPIEYDCKKSRTRREPYYKVSPKREISSESSDMDDPK